MTSRVAGVDGCRAGWLVAELDVSGPGSVSIRVDETIERVVNDVLAGRLAAAAIDMPLGLPESAKRASDAIVRRRLGPRHATMFPTPPRATLAATTWEDALAAARAATGTGISKQVFNLLPKIRELDRFVPPASHPDIAEAHPETSFAAMAGHPLTTSKKTAAGVDERVALLVAAIGVTGDVLADRPAGSAADDVLDGLAAAWTARRLVTGSVEWAGDLTDLDGRGRPMVVAI